MTRKKITTPSHNFCVFCVGFIFVLFFAAAIWGGGAVGWMGKGINRVSMGAFLNLLKKNMKLD